MKPFANKPIVRDYSLFLLVGVGALLIDAGVYALLTRWGGLYYLTARSVSLVLAVIWSYSANRKWTFRSAEKFYGTTLIRYVIVNAGSVLGNLLIFKYAVESLGLPDLPALLISAGAVSVGSFLANRYWTFRTD